MHRAALAATVLLVSSGYSDVKLFNSYPGQTVRTAGESRLVLSRAANFQDVTDRSGRRRREYVPGDRIVCVEPSPDAITARGRSAGAQARVPVSVGSPASAGAVEAALAYAAAQQTAYVGYRTATIQASRDIAFQAFIAYANGALDERDYRRVLAGTDNILLGMHTIDGLTGAMPAPPVIVGAGGNAGSQPGQPTTSSAAPGTVIAIGTGGPSQGTAAPAPTAAVGTTSRTATPDASDARAQHLATIADAVVAIVCHTVLNREPDPATGAYNNIPTWGCPRPGEQRAGGCRTRTHRVIAPPRAAPASADDGGTPRRASRGGARDRSAAVVGRSACRAREGLNADCGAHCRPARGFARQDFR